MSNTIMSLLRKDITGVVHEKRAFYLWFVMAMMTPIFWANPFFATIFCAFPFLSYISYLFSFDEKDGEEKFYASLPIRRKQMVISRYCGVTLFALAALGTAYLVSAAGRLILPSTVHPFPALFPVCYLGYFTLNVSLLVPMCYKVGFSRSRSLNMVLMMVPAVTGGLLVGTNRLSSDGPAIFAPLTAMLDVRVPLPLLATAIAACAFILIISARMSIRIFRRKEL